VPDTRDWGQSEKSEIRNQKSEIPKIKRQKQKPRVASPGSVDFLLLLFDFCFAFASPLPLTLGMERSEHLLGDGTFLPLTFTA
jgi:hypothetical protein